MADPMRLLIAYDGSDGAAAGIRAAGCLFPGAGAVIVHVQHDHEALESGALAGIATPDDVIAGVRRRQRAAHERAWELLGRAERVAEAAGLRPEPELRSGPTPWRAIADAAEAHDPDVVVCGKRGHGVFSRSLLGSTSSALLHHGRHPLLIVPPGEVRRGGPVVVGYDGSDGARNAIETAARCFPGREAIVVHGWSSPLTRSYPGTALSLVPVSDVQELTDDLTDLLAASAQDCAEAGAALAAEAGLAARGVEFECGPGAWRALRDVASREGAAVIVAGSGGRGAVRSAVLGSVSSGLAHNAETPVLIVR